MPDPSVRSVAADIGLGANPTSSLPAGAANGDVLVAMVHAEGSAASPATITPPTGWALITGLSGNRGHGGGDSLTWGVYWIKVGGSAPALAWTTASTYNEITTICVQDSDGTIAAQSATGADGELNTHLPDPPSVTAPAGNCLVITGGETWQGSAAGGWSAPAGYIQRGDTGTGVCSCMATLAGVTGAQNPGAFGNGDTHAGPEPMYWDGFAVALQPAAPSTPPFVPVEFPQPRHRPQPNSGFASRMATPLVGQDRLVGGPGQPLANCDWPVPAPRAYPKGLAGDTLGMSLAIRLSIVPSAMPPGQPDFTRPSRRVVAPDLLTFIGFYVIDGSPTFTQTDWPTPPPKLYPIALRTYVQPSNRALLRDVAFGGDGKPFAPIPDAEVPQWKRYPVDLRTWAQSLVLSTLSLPTPPPFSQQDWPNPPFAKFLRDPRGLVHALSLVLRDAGFGAAGQTKTYDWPVPPFTPLPVALRTWINTVRLHLIGRDTFFGAAGQTKTYDWPLPQRRRHPIIPVEPWPLFLAVAVPVTPPIPPAAEVAPLGVRTGPIVDGGSPRHGPITEAAGRRRW